MHAFELHELIADAEKAGKPYLEFLRVPDLSAGLYRLPTGGIDPQLPHTKDEVSGVFYPSWPDGDFNMTYTWDVLVFGISDGAQKAVARFQPLQYGATADEAESVVEGLYTFAQTGEQRYAQLHFQNERLTQVLGFTSESDLGAPREITSEQGDTFMIYQRWMDVNADGQATNIAKQPGTTLTFGSEPFTWVELDAAAGDYVIGFIAEDLDGNQHPAYTQVRVQ